MIVVNNSVANVRNTPGIITGLFAELPVRGTNGLIFISTDTSEIYSWVEIALSWVLIATVGAGATPSLQQVCTVGFSTNTNIELNKGSGIGIKLINSTPQPIIRIVANGVNYCEIKADNVVLNNELQLPTNNGVLALSVNGNFATNDGNVTLPGVTDFLQYNPLFSALNNLDTVTIPDTLFYQQIGNVVRVWGLINIDNVATGLLGQSTFEMDLPVASDFSGGNTSQLSGSINCGGQALLKSFESGLIKNNGLAIGAAVIELFCDLPSTLNVTVDFTYIVN